MLKMLINKPYGSASGITFEAYVLRTFRDGGHTFELKNLQTGKSVHLNIPRSPKDYLTSAEKVYENVPADIKPVKQYVLKIDVKAAATGQSPGLEVSVQRNPPRTRKRA
ncbi:hypothetical protein BGZ59_001596 [Podila verticillata]|nr:hypothetical protein BGZ59_001596 [Podila verticillata]